MKDVEEGVGRGGTVGVVPAKEAVRADPYVAAGGLVDVSARPGMEGEHGGDEKDI